MNYTITHNTRYTYSDAVPVCHNMVHLRPRALPHQMCKDFRLVVHPEPNDLREQVDVYGNHATYFSIEQAHLGLNVTATSKILVRPNPKPAAGPAWDELAKQLSQDRSDTYLHAYEFAFPSSRTRPFVELTEYCQSSFPPSRPIIEASKELTERIFEDFEYDSTATTVSTPITSVFATKRGVCQDFAHVQLACFRALGLAARYVSGYLRTIPPEGQERLVGADASHAWVSVFCGPAGWIDFDPTNNVIPSTDHVTLAWGRDYRDVAPIRGVILGGGSHMMDVSVDVAPGE